MTAIEAKQIPASDMAYLGDSVMEILVRRYLLLHPTPGGEHPSQRSLAFVKAGAQSDAVERILPLLTEEETDEYKRGRNSVHGNVPKSASQAQYRRATGLECLFAFLYLTDRMDRAEQLFLFAYQLADEGKSIL